MDQKNTWIIKICCVIAAFSLWMYIINETNTEKTQDVTVQVELTNVDVANSKGYAVLPGQQFEVTLKVSGSTADIAAGKGQFKVVADLGIYTVTKGDNNIPIRVERQPANVNVMNSQALFVKIVVDDLIKKTLPVKVNLSGKVKDGYYAYSENLSPTEVEVSGAAKFVNQVVTVEAKSDFKSTDKDLNMKLTLRALDAAGREIKDVIIRPDTAEVIVPVKKTKTVPITVDTKGTLNKLYAMKTIAPTPDKIDIAGDEAIINSITALKTEQIDLGTLTPDKVVAAKILVPPGVSLLDSDGTVKVKATLSNVISKNFQGTIQLKNLSDAFTAALDVSKLTIDISGPEDIVSAIKNEDFNYTIDAAGFTEEKEYTVAITPKVPEGTVKLSQNPQSVKITVKKKEAQPTTTTPTAPNTNGGQ